MGFEGGHVFTHFIDETEQARHGVPVCGEAHQGLFGRGHFHVTLGQRRR